MHHLPRHGRAPGTSPKVCPVCNGRGVEAQGQGVFSITRPCSRCGGTGTVIEDPCPTCAGEGRLREMKRYRVNIPAGVQARARGSRLAGKGEAGLRGGPPGDLYVVTHVDESTVFKRKGDNFEVEVPITVAEALGGAEVEVPTLHGTKKLRVAPGTKHGTLQRLRGEGPPSCIRFRPGRPALSVRDRDAQATSTTSSGRPSSSSRR